ncbi:DUF6262 family protein [Pantanalinema sp. GBBB05]|uniref:DUF6262 family protein n=1 Tax=Pantanalinema sp. GBBB05 TaxID=2604139 RepID=UPI001D997C16|nr:hypothetical protein [Pantanalinema sp. GBBB05]
MKHQRNVEGLRQNAQKKRQESFEKVDRAIQTLLKEGRPINFVNVEEVSGVSKAWLYKEPEVKARIEHLRAQGGEKQAAKPQQKMSDASKDSIIATLKLRIAKLDQRNRELSQQNEVFGGQVLRVRELEQQVKRLQTENTMLQQQLGGSTQAQGSIWATADSLNLSTVEKELERLGVQLNSTIQRLLDKAPHDIIAVALESLREAVLEGRADNPSGFFYRAVTDAWKPNEAHEEKAEAELFSEWWKLAHQKGLVIAATQEEGVQYVMTSDEQWVPFSEMLDSFPLEALTR